MNERSIFEAALDIESRTEREAYVARACGADQLLRRAVEKLLEAHDEPGDFMLRPAPDLITELDSRAAVEGPGSVIGAYKLLEQIGEGGFGVVYMAEQSRPVQRCVALKVLKAGMDTRQVIARFEAERQALALMDHPNIARVFDGGETASGRPYFVMELVRGVPITQFCDSNDLPVRQRLELFIDVCQAIQHAHQKGIIHRDLKPSNVLITLHDDRAVVKVIDFGIAKATQQRLTEKTLFTSFAQLIGTPLYMSPEQAQISGLDVDTRSDVYSLGVLLYELLTGTTPFDGQRLKTASYDEVRRIILEEEPPKPSTRITSGKGQERSSSGRRGEPRELGRILRGELDWIVMKCLEKDRDRRYATVGGLAADVERYLHDEPVQACPPSAGYRFRKFARRHRVRLIVASSVLLFLLSSIALLLTSNIRVREEQARTQAEKIRAERAEWLALRHAREVTEGLQSLKAANELVDTARHFIAERRWNSASDAFTRALELRSEHAPAWEGRGVLLASLGLWDLAAVDLARAAALQPPVTANRWLLIALTRAHVDDVVGYRTACQRMGDLLQGTTVSHFAMDMVRANGLRPDSPLDADRLVEVAAAIVASHPGVGWFVHVLGAAHYRAGQYQEAIRRLKESLSIDPQWNARAINYPFLAMAYARLGRHDEARDAASTVKRTIDEWTASRYTAGGNSYWVVSQGSTDFWPVPWWDWMACQLTYGEARRVMGLPPPPEDVRLRVLRARAFAGLRWSERAVAEYDHALELSPDDEQILLEAHRARGQLHIAHKRWDDAAVEYAAASDLRPDEPYFWWYRAVLRLAGGDQEAYGQICASFLDRFRSTDDPRTAHAVVSACTILPGALHDLSRLVPVGEIAARWYPGSVRMLAAAQCRAGAYEEAVHHYRRASIHYRLRADDRLLLGIALYHSGDVDAARESLREAVNWIERADGRQLNDPAGTQGWGDWTERVCVPLLRRELEGLFE